MANFDELLGLVCESAESDFVEFDKIASNLNKVRKDFKANLKSKDFDGAKNNIGELEEISKDLRDFINDISDETYDSKKERIVKKVVSIVEIAVGMFLGLDAIWSNDASPKTFIQAFGGGMLQGHGENDAVKAMSADEVKKYLTKVVNNLDKEIDKAKKKFDKKMRKAENGTVKESAEVKLAIYESCHAGEISEEERDILLGIIE